MARNDVGFDEVAISRQLRKLDQLPDKLKHKTINNLAKFALRPVRKDAKQEVLNHAQGTDSDGFSKAYQVAMSIKVFGSKRGFPPGAYIRVKGKDIRVNEGPKGRDWRVGGYAKVISGGATNRKWRQSSHHTGSVEGIGNFIIDNALKHEGFMARYFEQGMIKEMDKAKKKLGFR